MSEVSAALDVPVASIRAVIKLKNWGGRLRVTKTHYRGAGGTDDALSADALLSGSGNYRAVADLTGISL
tara:strand:- start:488 stop:694 length:207 start_codon:yes stop_codon:yes gene_type:complete